MYMYLVLNNEFNRRYYPSLIGQRFVNPPLYPYPRASRPVQVRRIRRPSGTELVARERKGSNQGSGQKDSAS